MFTKAYCALGYRCNNNCLICVVDAFRNRHKNMTTREILQFYDKNLEKNKDTKILELSGGEPTIREDILYIMSYLTQKYPDLSFAALSNGRRFSNFAFSQQFSKYNIEGVIIALHHCIEKEHDEQTQVKGSFKQTVCGIKNISGLGVPVTVKIIVTKMNYKAMDRIVEFVAKNFPLVKNMSINGLDIRARAEQFKDRVAVSFTDYIPYVHKAIDIAEKYNINMVLYSIPLCVIGEKYRKYAGPQPDIISLYGSPTNEVKNKTEDHGYMPECKNCVLNKKCYGTWFSYFDVFGTGELKIQKQQQNKIQKNIFFINSNGTCNSNCIFCCEFGSRPKRDISFRKLKQKINKLEIKKKDTVIISGGEPTLCLFIIPLIKYIQKYTKNIEMLTNAIKLADMNFCTQLTKTGLKKFCIPVHAHNLDLHNKITRTKISFEKTVVAIKNLVSLNCEITIKILMHKMNYKYLKNIVEFASRNFEDKFDILFSFASINGSAIENKNKLSIDASTVAPYLNSAIDFCRTRNIVFNIDKFPVCVLKNKNYSAGLRQETIYIDEDKNNGFDDNVVCKTCRLYKTKCNGVWESYIREYGVREFNPQ